MTGVSTLEFRLYTHAGETQDGCDTVARAGEDLLLAERGRLLLLLLLLLMISVFLILLLLQQQWWWR